MIMLDKIASIKVANQGFNNGTSVFNVAPIVIKMVFCNHIEFAPKLLYHLILPPVVVMPGRKDKLCFCLVQQIK